MNIFALLQRLRRRSSLPPPSPFAQTVITAKICNHSTALIGRVSAFGETIKTEMPRNEDGSVDYCLDCIAKMAIQCAWCGQPIFIGDPVTLCTPDKKFLIPKYAVQYSQEPLRLAGCLRWKCADTGACRAGFWVPGDDGKGRVHRVQSPFEALFESEGSAIIVNDVGDPTKAHTPIIIHAHGN